MHIVYIVGNRPQFVKLGILHRQIKQYDFIKETIIHTGQHFSAEMSDIFFEQLEINLPIRNLNINSLSHIAMIGKTMEALEFNLKDCAPDVVVVFGDTNATLAGALTAKKLHIPVMHIEAGIRTFDDRMPEETNRYITDRISDINFCCTYLGMQHLGKEGYNSSNIQSRAINSGDLMLDAFYYFNNQQKKAIKHNAFKHQGDFILTTFHRKQNLENPQLLLNIIEALNEINRDMPVICPMHPNTKQVLKENGIHAKFETILPQGYFDLQNLLSRARYVITDSGGLQREAFFAQKPTLILMEKPFWPEVIEHGNALSTPSTKASIMQNYHDLKGLQKENEIAVFGNGQAAAIIADEIVSFYNVGKAGTL